MVISTKLRWQTGSAKLGFLVFILILGAVFGVAALHRQDIYDYLALRHYQPNTVISQIASQDTMNAYTRKVFYVNHPVIEGRTTFSKACPDDGGEQTIVLGCYHAGQQGIFLLNITDTQLQGVVQVTAAHETLHAIYDRLSAKKRDQVDALLLDYYNHGLTDARIKTTIAAYRKTEPNDVVNEMHSIFGTEIVNLPAPLEQYYSQYFTNRKAIAQFATTYQSEFTSRQTAVKQDDATLATLKTQIDDNRNTLATDQAAITAAQKQLQAERASGDIAGYNAGVPGFNAQVTAYNALVGRLQTLINQYNGLVATRNQIALQEQQLVNALSAQPAPITTN